MPLSQACPKCGAELPSHIKAGLCPKCSLFAAIFGGVSQAEDERPGHPVGVSVESTLIGTRLNQYEIVSLLGAGGMGEVYRARDTKLGREVAVKVLPKEVASDTTRLRRFELEARALASLNHPNILVIHDTGVHDGTPYLVSELLEGASLRKALRDGALPQRQAIEYALQIAHGLQSAHDMGLIHRDLKPENVFIAAGNRIKILDFGLAKLSTFSPAGLAMNSVSNSQAGTVAAVEMTVPGTVLGTPAYMSPEQVRGDSIDNRSDIFAFGAIIYEMLSGVKAFQRGTSVETMTAILNENPPELSTVAPAIFLAVVRLTQRCLEKEPARRFQTASDLAFALENGALDHEPPDRHRRAESLEPARLASVSSRARPPAATGGGDSTPSHPGPDRTPALAHGFWRRAILGLLALSALVAGVMVWQHTQKQAALVPSLAVLPFDNYSSDTNNSYLSEGITEDLTTILGQVEGLRVPGRTSTQISYNANKKDFRKIGAQLGVAWVLEGSIRALGEKTFRLNAQLISAEKNQLRWSTGIDTSVSQLAWVHFDLARSILGALKLKCPVSLTAPPGPTANPDAIKLFLRGRQQLNRRTREGLLKGQDFFEQALQIEPMLAEALSGEADCYNYLAYGNYWAPKEAFPKAMAASRRALEINPNLAEAHAALGYALLYYEWQWTQAELEFKEAIRLNPKSALPRDYYSVFLAASKRPDEAREQIKQAQDLDPLSLPITADMAFQLYYDRNYDGALHQLKEALEINPDFPLARFWLGRVYTTLHSNELALAQFETADLKLSKWQPMLAAKGYFFGVLQKRDDALKVLHEFDSIEQTGAFVTSYGRALVYAGLGDHDNALNWLDRALDERSHWLIWLELDPRWDSLRAEKRFKELVAKVGRPSNM